MLQTGVDVDIFWCHRVCQAREKGNDDYQIAQ
jgi:hypothetical protein